MDQDVANEEHYVDPSCEWPCFFKILFTPNISKVGTIPVHVDIIDVTSIYDTRERKETIDDKYEDSFVHQFKIVIQLRVVRFDNREDSELCEEAD